jgi:hypothetical protein
VAVCFVKLIQVFDMFQRSDHAFDSCWRSIEHRGRWRCAVSDTHAQWSWQRSCHSYHHPVIEQDWGCTINCRDFFSDQGQGTLLAPDPTPHVSWKASENGEKIPRSVRYTRYTVPFSGIWRFHPFWGAVFTCQIYSKISFCPKISVCFRTGYPDKIGNRWKTTCA